MGMGIPAGFSEWNEYCGWNRINTAAPAKCTGVCVPWFMGEGGLSTLPFRPQPRNTYTLMADASLSAHVHQAIPATAVEAILACTYTGEIRISWMTATRTNALNAARTWPVLYGVTSVEGTTGDIFSQYIGHCLSARVPWFHERQPGVPPVTSKSWNRLKTLR